jgi:hypothetical protein
MSYEQQLGLLGADQNTWPPDTQLAVGPTNVVEIVNNNLSIRDRSGTLSQSYDLASFFPVPSGYLEQSPRLLYDQLSSRFIASAAAADQSGDGQVYLAVSATTDPTGIWYEYVVTTNTSGTTYDQPKLGVNSDKIVLSWADFANSCVQLFCGQETWVIEKSQAIGGTSPTYAAFAPDIFRFGMVPSQELTDSSVEYVVYNNADPFLEQNQRFPTVGIYAISGTPLQGNVSAIETVPSMKSTSFPPDAAQPGSGPRIATNDDRFLSAMWQNGVLWTGGNNQCEPEGDNGERSCLRLVQIATGGSAPAVNQSFDVGIAGADLYYPAVVMDGAGDLFVSLTWSSATQYASAATLGQAVTAPPGTVGALLTVENGLGVYDNCGANCLNPDGTSNNLWGSYSGAAPDPGNPVVVWLAAESAGSTFDQLDWATTFAEAALPATPIVSATPSATATATASPTITPTPTDTASPSNTSSSTSTRTPSNTPMPTNSPVATNTPTPVIIPVTPSVSAVVTASVGANLVQVQVPASDGISQIELNVAPPPAITPSDPDLQPVPGASIVVSASGNTGEVHALNEPVTITIQFSPPPSVNPAFAVIYTFACDGCAAEALATTIHPNGDGSYTAVAETSHLSPFVVFASNVGTPVPVVFLPIVTAGSSFGW